MSDMARITARDKLIDATVALMSTRGFNATTVDDIVSHAGVAKGSVYHAFNSKQALAIAALERYLQLVLAILNQAPETKITDPAAKALATVDFIEARSVDLWACGSLLGSMMVETGDKHATVTDHIDMMFRRLESSLAAIFAPALASTGVVGITSRDLSLHLLAIIEGSIVMARSHSEPQYLQQGIRHFRKYLEFILRS